MKSESERETDRQTACLSVSQSGTVRVWRMRTHSARAVSTSVCVQLFWFSAMTQVMQVFSLAPRGRHDAARSSPFPLTNVGCCTALFTLLGLFLLLFLSVGVRRWHPPFPW